ncbi:hypothetical protein L9F63_007329, partial [Diploptera punctata]
VVRNLCLLMYLKTRRDCLEMWILIFSYFYIYCLIIRLCYVIITEMELNPFLSGTTVKLNLDLSELLRIAPPLFNIIVPHRRRS